MDCLFMIKPSHRRACPDLRKRAPRTLLLRGRNTDIVAVVRRHAMANDTLEVRRKAGRLADCRRLNGGLALNRSVDGLLLFFVSNRERERGKSELPTLIK